MRDDPEKLPEAEDGDGPACQPIGEGDQPSPGLPVLGELLAVRVDQDVRVDGDQRRPSILS
jgi:hypothetical protein